MYIEAAKFCSCHDADLKPGVPTFFLTKLASPQNTQAIEGGRPGCHIRASGFPSGVSRDGVFSSRGFGGVNRKLVELVQPTGEAGELGSANKRHYRGHSRQRIACFQSRSNIHTSPRRSASSRICSIVVPERVAQPWMPKCGGFALIQTHPPLSILLSTCLHPEIFTKCHP